MCKVFLLTGTSEVAGLRFVDVNVETCRFTESAFFLEKYQLKAGGSADPVKRSSRWRPLRDAPGGSEVGLGGDCCRLRGGERPGESWGTPRRWIPAAGVPTGPPPLSRTTTPGERCRAGARGADVARETGGPLWPPERLAVPRWGRGGGPGPRDPPAGGNLNLEACWGSGPARRSEWRPRGGKEVNRRSGGSGGRRRAVTPPLPHPCSNKRGLSRARARVERELDCGRI
ncbi:hypothetical protein NDU88_004515 [Pleurodeles waltl]|uniref:Uncharacterized protein n=1 Tax=Pleurodeles waltl TaxID=8319 RepID=A0AAV7RJU2_PLEWA|nr:hypothetical protein NDU88_004515 [Pleurodeles waltl]